jgi:hypothetical protein
MIFPSVKKSEVKMTTFDFNIFECIFNCVNDNVIAMHECVNAIKEKVENKGSMKRVFENTVCQWICKCEKLVEEL